MYDIKFMIPLGDGIPLPPNFPKLIFNWRLYNKMIKGCDLS